MTSGKTALYIGLSIIDVSTGKCTVYETFSRSDDTNYSLDEAFRFIQVYDPKEIVIYKHPNIDTDTLSNSYISSYLDLSQRVVHFHMCESHIFNINYQCTFWIFF